MCLISCSKELNRKENWHDLKPSSREKLLYRYDQDLNACKTCVMCLKGHWEGHPRSRTTVAQATRGLCDPSCGTSVRLTNTHMLCRVCVEDMDSRTKPFRYTWSERWQHTCELEWRGDVLMLRVTSRLSFTGRHARNVPHWDVRGGHRYLDRCNECGCHKHVYSGLVKGITAKMRGYFTDYKDEPTTWRDLIRCSVQCSVCAAYYAISLTESRQESTIIVTRFSDMAIRPCEGGSPSKTSDLSKSKAFLETLTMSEVGMVMYFIHKYRVAMARPHSKRFLTVSGLNVVIEKTLDWIWGERIFSKPRLPL